jgi:GNAT superfamily N-acetyltransferase
MNCEASRKPRAAIRVSFLADHPEVLPLVARWLHRQFLAAQGFSRAGVAVALRERLRRSEPPIGMVAYLGRYPAGTVSITVDRLPGEADAQHLTLSGLYVVPRARNRGAGAMLCQAAVCLAAQAGAPSLWLCTATAETWFQRLGWCTTASELVALGPRSVMANCMRREITARDGDNERGPHAND